MISLLPRSIQYTTPPEAVSEIGSGCPLARTTGVPPVTGTAMIAPSVTLLSAQYTVPLSTATSVGSF